MVNNIAIRFLGTTSQTNVTRNYSSLLVKLDHQTVMVDCGESTQRQLQNRSIGGEEKLSSIRRILITHLHMDHVSGLVPLLCSMMGPGNALSPSDKSPRVEIFGPSGLRALLRTTLTLCYATLSGYYKVHELLWPSQSAYPNEPLTSIEGDVVGASIPEGLEPLIGATNGPRRTIPHLPPHENELPGKDFRLDEDTVSWPHITAVDGVSISAAPILHRCPTVGYIFNEPPSSSSSVTPEMLSVLNSNAAALETEQNIRNPKILLGKLLKERQSVLLPDGTRLEPPSLDIRGRKLVVLGDTYDATAGLDGSSRKGVGAVGQDSVTRGMLALAQDADVLVHECTNAALPAHLQLSSKKGDENREEIRAKALLRGHSTPQVAGQFAAKCGVRQLLLNHLGIKYPAPSTRSISAPSGAWNGNSVEPSHEKERRYLAIKDIEQQATEAWHEGIESRQTIHVKSARARKAIATFDGYVYRVVKIMNDPGEPNSASYFNEDKTAVSVGDQEEQEDLGASVKGEERVSDSSNFDQVPRQPQSMKMRGRDRGQFLPFVNQAPFRGGALRGNRGRESLSAHHGDSSAPGNLFHRGRGRGRGLPFSSSTLPRGFGSQGGRGRGWGME